MRRRLTWICLVLGALGCAREEEIDVKALLEQAKDADADVRYMAVKQLGDLGSEGGEALSTLTNALRDTDATVRIGAVYALGQLGPIAGPAEPELREALLKDAEIDVRVGAAYALPSLGPAAEASLPALRSLTNHANAQLRDKSRLAIRHIERGRQYRSAQAKIDQSQPKSQP